MEERYEKAIKGSRETREYYSFLNAWKAAGSPREFKWSHRSGRIMATAALREKLYDRLNPEAAKDRRARDEKCYKKRLNRLNYS
ncbi:MAG: hypothetical protein EHM85_17265 [Desulfobacteraceae bacterium]|nr:MAG: hypothetical protein EHM85_17265 [Desulfobacteraceae bacterium]